jgi:protein-S-isoprenylcysteine O-methyltransferase Ste14
MALGKLPWLFALFILYYISATAPNPPASHKEIAKYPHDRLSGKNTMQSWVALKVCHIFDMASYHSTLKYLQVFILLVIFLESVVIVSSHFETSTFAQIVLNILTHTHSDGTPTKHGPTITPVFLVGFFLCLCGTYGRWAAYHALGQLFTYEVSIRDQHKLITTFPYSVVRHPGYISAIVVFTGITPCLFGPGSWIFECGLLELLAVEVIAVAITAFYMYILYLVLSRMDKEDRMMKKEFGRQWDDWAQRVQYRLVPGLF